jgi:Zn-dependent M16 (insulinase) family peptidase
VEDLHQLEKEPEEFWLQLLKEYLLDSPSMTVRGYPSLEEQRRLAKNEKQRISEQQQKFGEKGLQELGYQLQQAMVENEVSCNSLHTHSSSFMRTGSHEV